MTNPRGRLVGWVAGVIGALSLCLVAVPSAQAWTFLPKEGKFVYPRIDAVGYLTAGHPEGIGRVVTTKAERAVNIGEGETIYVNVGARHGIKVGDLLVAYGLHKPRELRDVRVVSIQAKLRVTAVAPEESAAVIQESYTAVSIGSRVDRYVPRQTDIPLRPAPAGLGGRIIWDHENQVSFGQGDVVFLDRGSADGVAPGQCYEVFRVPVAEVMPPPRKGAPPREHLTTAVGELLILRAEADTAAALIRKSLLPLERGDYYRAGCPWEAQLAKAAPAGPPEDEAFRRAREVFENQDVSFPYDSYSLGPEARRILEEKARFLQAYPEVRTVIEGHCDERGTENYNLALGDRRAHACKQYLAALGIAADRMKTVSYGKERPLDPGHDEAAWARNRRAHFAVERP